MLASANDSAAQSANVRAAPEGVRPEPAPEALGCASMNPTALPTGPNGATLDRGRWIGREPKEADSVTRAMIWEGGSSRDRAAGRGRRRAQFGAK